MGDEPTPIIREPDEDLRPPVSQVPWSPDVVAQSIEVLPIYSDAGSLLWLKPIHAPSLRIGWPVRQRPSDAVLSALARYGIVPSIVHSTSWREDQDHLLLTYLCVIPPPSQSNPNLEPLRVERSDLARGRATEAPDVIGMGQVVEHALRHLAWLLHDDPAIGEELGDWKSLLSGYEPEPFRSFRSE